MPRIICSTSLRRNFRHLDEDRFRRLILASSVYEHPKSNTNDFANQIIDDLVKVLDELVPLKKSTRRCGKQTRWLSAEAIVSRRARRRLERRYRRTKSEADRVAYRSACRATNKLIINSRKDYARNRLADATGNPRQRWQITNELLHRNDKSTRSTPSADLTPERCNLFCRYFVTKLSSIASKIDEQLKSLCSPSLPSQDFHKPTVFNGFKQVSVLDVQRIIAKLSPKTSPLDCIPVTLVKSCSDIFSDLLSKLANLSFTEGIFPDQFKSGQVTPIPKKHGLAADDP